MMENKLTLLWLGLAFVSGMDGGRAAAAPAEAVSLAGSSRNFPAGILHSQWTRFEARGYAQPVTGVVYRGRPRPTCGMPLGGLDTGCLDIEPTGMLGYSTIFNQLFAPRGIYNAPFLGLSVDGKTCLLATDTRGKEQRPLYRDSGLWPPFDYTPGYFDVGLSDVARAQSIDYWGHYPMLDMEFDTARPIEVGLRAFSPLVPGDSKTSMLPGAVFDFSLRNPTDASHRGTLVFSFPGFDATPSKSPRKVVRKMVSGELTGVSVSTVDKGNAREMSYALVCLDGSAIRQGGSLGTDGTAWNSIEKGLPAASAESSGATLGLDFELAPGATTTRRVVLAWHAPYWNASGSPDTDSQNVFAHMYAKHYADALVVARKLAADHVGLEKRIIAWQKRSMAMRTRRAGWPTA
jgi:hypothetical protein